jgi:hypothetical protein
LDLTRTLQWQRMCGRVSSVDWHTRHSREKSSLHLDLFLFIGTTFIRARCTNLQSLKRMFNLVNIQEDPLAKPSLTIARATFPSSGRLTTFGMHDPGLADGEKNMQILHDGGHWIPLILLDHHHRAQRMRC